MTDRIDVAVIKSIRRHLLRIKSVEEATRRANAIQVRAFKLMNQLANRVDIHRRIEGQCGRFNRYVAELLIARDYDVRNGIAPPQIAYLRLQLASHHIVKGSEFNQYAAAFQRLAAKTNNGWWTSKDTMPAMPLFAELHGLSDETLAAPYKMIKQTTEGMEIDLNKFDPFTSTLNNYVKTRKKTGSFAELFEIHRDFYDEVMNDRFFRDKSMIGIDGKSLAEWFNDMIKLAKEVDAEMATNP